MIPARTPFFLPMLYPSLTWRMETTESVLYLTFDDGPVPGPTEFVLDSLSRASVPATFFCIGDNIRRHPKLFARILADGHSAGNHTFHHLNGWKTPASAYLADIRDFQKEAIAAGLSKGTSLFRPPYGRITREQIRGLADYNVIMWDVLTRDYDRHLSKERCLSRTLAACRPGSIVVFHDSYKSERNMMYTLPRMLDHFLSKGYRFSAITMNNR